MPISQSAPETPDDRARRILSRSLRDSLRLTPREQAIAAHWAGGPSIDELEQKVIDYRRRIGFVEPEDRERPVE